jgi:hypothetical protein
MAAARAAAVGSSRTGVCTHASTTLRTSIHASGADGHDCHDCEEAGSMAKPSGSFTVFAQQGDQAGEPRVLALSCSVSFCSCCCLRMSAFFSGSGWWGLIPFFECVVDRFPEQANHDDQKEDWNAQQQKKDRARPEQQNGKADA